MIFGTLVIPIRGGFQLIPVNQSNVYFSSKMFANHASINYAWNFANALTHKSDGQNPYKFFKKEVAKNTINTIKNTLLVADTDRILNTTKPNVMKNDLSLSLSLYIYIYIYTERYKKQTRIDTT